MSQEQPSRIEVLIFEGCPHAAETIERVRQVVSRAGIATEVKPVVVATPDAARRLAFLGSPTVRVDGIDIDPAARDRSDFGLGCRLYGGSGVPPVAMIEAALTRMQ